MSQEAQAVFGVAVSARCLNEADLYGGKICAALDRQHPRDLFDILPLMERANELADNIRKAFLVYALSHPKPLAELLDLHPQPLEQIFRTEFFRHDAGAGRPEELGRGQRMAHSGSAIRAYAG